MTQGEAASHILWEDGSMTLLTRLRGAMVPLFMSGVAVAYLISARNVSDTDMVLVRVCASGIFAFSAFVVLNALRGRDAPEVLSDQYWRPAALTALIAAFIWGASYDFTSASAVFLVAAMLLMGERKPLRIVCVSALFAPAVYLLFSTLGVPLPNMIF